MKAPPTTSLKKQIPSNLSLIGRRIVSGLLFFIFVAVAAGSDELPYDKITPIVKRVI